MCCLKKMWMLRTRRISGWGWPSRARDLEERLWWVKLVLWTHPSHEPPSPGVVLKWNSAAFGHFRLVLTAIRSACSWTRLRSHWTSLAAVMSSVRTWLSTRPLMRMEGTGTSVRAEPEAMRCLALASRVWRLPSPRTTIMWCLEHQELTTGKVPNTGYSETRVSHSFKACLSVLILIYCTLLASSVGIVRVEQKNNTLLEMEVYDDGPYEVGDEHLLNPELVPVPANSYLGECQSTSLNLVCILLTLLSLTSIRGISVFTIFFSRVWGTFGVKMKQRKSGGFLPWQHMNWCIAVIDLIK